MKNLNLKLTVCEDLGSLERLRPAWEDLLASYPAASIFSTWEWLAPWWRAFGGGQQLLVFAFFDDGKLAALAPLSIGTQRGPGGIKLRVLRLMGDGSQDSDNLDLPVRPGYEDAFVDAFLGYLKNRSSLWDFAELNTLPSNSLLGRGLLPNLGKRKWTYYSLRYPCSAVALPATWQEYASILSSEDRNNLTRYTRRLEKRYQVRMYKCTDEGQLPTCLEVLFDLHQKRWRLRNEPGSFGSLARRQFYNEMARVFLARDWLELWVMELNQRIVAVQYAFRYGSTVYQLQEGFEPDHSPDRVGFILRGHVLQHLIEQGVRVYDFLGGQAPSKARWGAQVSNYIDLHFARPRTLGAAYLRLRSGAHESKEWLRAHLPRTAWSALHRIKVRLRGASSAAGTASEE